MNFPNFNPNLLLQASQAQSLLPTASNAQLTFPGTSFGTQGLQTPALQPNLEQLLADAKSTRQLANEHLKTSAEDIFRLQEQVRNFKVRKFFNFKKKITKNKFDNIKNPPRSTPTSGPLSSWEESSKVSSKLSRN